MDMILDKYKLQSSLLIFRNIFCLYTLGLPVCVPRTYVFSINEFSP